MSRPKYLPKPLKYLGQGGKYRGGGFLWQLRCNVLVVQFSRDSDSIVLVVTHLSFFCCESDLFSLFNEYGSIKAFGLFRRVTRNNNIVMTDILGTVIFAKITMDAGHQAEEMIRIMNNHLFLGRRLR